MITLLHGVYEASDLNSCNLHQVKIQHGPYNMLLPTCADGLPAAPTQLSNKSHIFWIHLGQLEKLFLLDTA